MIRRCRYCDRPIYKFLLGWLHRNDGYPFPTTVHIARPRRGEGS